MTIETVLSRFDVMRRKVLFTFDQMNLLLVLTLFCCCLLIVELFMCQAWPAQWHYIAAVKHWGTNWKLVKRFLTSTVLWPSLWREYIPWNYLCCLCYSLSCSFLSCWKLELIWWLMMMYGMLQKLMFEIWTSAAIRLKFVVTLMQVFRSQCSLGNLACRGPNSC